MNNGAAIRQTSSLLVCYLQQYLIFLTTINGIDPVYGNICSHRSMAGGRRNIFC